MVASDAAADTLSFDAPTMLRWRDALLFSLMMRIFLIAAHIFTPH